MEQTDHDIRMLIKESARGDAESYKELYGLLVDKIFTYVRSRTKTREHAIDITQDTLIDFFSIVSNFTYQSRAQFYSYIFVITRRKLARYYELQKRGGNEFVEFDEESMSPDSGEIAPELRNDVAQAL